MIGTIPLTSLGLYFIMELLQIKDDRCEVLKFAFLSSIFLKYLRFLLHWWLNSSNQSPVFPLGQLPELYFLFFLTIYSCWFYYAAYLVWMAYRRTVGIEKYQYQTIFIGFIISFVAGLTNYPLFWEIPIKPIGIPFTMAYVVFTAYAALRYRLFRITHLSRLNQSLPQCRIYFL